MPFYTTPPASVPSSALAPTASSPASVSPPLEPGGLHSLAGEGAGEPIRMTGEKAWLSVYSVGPFFKLKCICNYLFHLMHTVINIWFGKCARTMYEKAKGKQKLETRGKTLHGTGGHSGTIPPVTCYFCMRLVATIMQSGQFFASKLGEQLFELKMKTPFKIPRIYPTHLLAKCYPSTLCMARSKLMRPFL